MFLFHDEVKKGMIFKELNLPMGFFLNVEATAQPSRSRNSLKSAHFHDYPSQNKCDLKAASISRCIITKTPQPRSSLRKRMLRIKSLLKAEFLLLMLMLHQRSVAFTLGRLCAASNRGLDKTRLIHQRLRNVFILAAAWFVQH